LALGKEQLSANGTYSILWGLGSSRKWRLGGGIRYTGYYANNRDYITAPASLTRGEKGIPALFASPKTGNIDTLRLETTYTNILNLHVAVEYAVAPKWALGASTDIAGFGYGRRSIGDYKAAAVGTMPAEESFFNESRQTAKPAPVNIFGIGQNATGSLYAEVYARYQLSAAWGLKAGLSHITSEFTTDRKLALNNSRYRYTALLGQVGVTFRPFVKKL
jgi:hypothetical protein